MRTKSYYNAKHVPNAARALRQHRNTRARTRATYSGPHSSPAGRRHVNHWVSLKVVRRVAELARSLQELGLALLQVDRATADHTQVK